MLDGVNQSCNQESFQDPTAIPQPEHGKPTAYLDQQYGGHVQKYDAALTDPKEIANLNDYPPGDQTGKEKIQFNKDGTCYLWQKQENPDPSNPTAPYAMDSWIEKNGTVHHMSQQDIVEVSSGQKTITDVIKTYGKGK